MPAKREIVYPVFIKVSVLTEDAFWKEIFMELAYGISPPGTYINKGVLCSNQNSKEFIYRFQEKDPQKIMEDIMRLFKKNNFMSKNDRKIIFQEFNDAQTKLSCMKNTEWVNIKKKNLK